MITPRSSTRARAGAGKTAVTAIHNLERIADRCTHICERVIYLVTGRMEEINVSRY